MIGYFFLVNLKKITQYKTDFLIGIIPHVVLQAIDLLFIKTIFSSVGTVRGWHADELFLIYGLFTLNFGFFSLIFGNLNNTKYYLFSGEFDVMRLRPISSILHIMLSSFKTQALEQILAGCIITRYAFSSLEINVGLSEIIAFVIFISSGVLILGSLAIISISTLLITNGTFSLLTIILGFKELVKYPIDIFAKPIRQALTWFIPLALVSYYPAVYFLGKKSFSILICIIIALVLFAISVAIYRICLKKYNGLSS